MCLSGPEMAFVATKESIASEYLFSGPVMRLDIIKGAVRQECKNQINEIYFVKHTKKMVKHFIRLYHHILY